jgi:flagellar biosynthesis component FlhA
MKRTIGTALEMAVAAGLLIAAAGSTVSAAGSGPANGLVRDIASAVTNDVAALPPTMVPGSVAPETRFSFAEVIGQAVQRLPEQEQSQIADKMAARHIQLMERQQGLESLSPQERDQLATAMVRQKMPTLQEGGNGSGAERQLMEKVRDNVMRSITNDIAQHNQALCRPIIQPHVVTGIIDKIRPAEIPAKIQVNTIPMFTPRIIEQVRKHFTKQAANN